LQAITKWITGMRLPMLILELLISNPTIERLLTLTIRISMGIFYAELSILDRLFGFSLENLIVRILKLPLIRETVINIMVMLRPVMRGIEPEALYVFAQLMRVRGFREMIMPMIMSTGVIIETLAAPEVVYKMGKKGKG
jgi:hypothetical protein